MQLIPGGDLNTNTKLVRWSSERRTGRGLYCWRCWHVFDSLDAHFLETPPKGARSCTASPPAPGAVVAGHSQASILPLVGPHAWQRPPLPSCQLEPAQAKNSEMSSAPRFAPITAISTRGGEIHPRCDAILRITLIGQFAQWHC